jgi:hypothetical protein
MKRKCVAAGIILLFAGSVVLPCLGTTAYTTSLQRPMRPSNDAHHLSNENKTRYLFCFVESGNVQHRNFTGKFFGVPTTLNNELRHFGIGSFTLDLLGWNENSDLRLKITRFHTITEYHQDVRISLKPFIGFYQPTGDLSSGALMGFTRSIQVSPLSPEND